MTETSFMSEHTAEYALVPDLITKLADRCSTIVPVYFWGRREGSRAGRESVCRSPVRVVAAFARRPKVARPGSDSILVKFNNVLFAAAHAGAEVGVPVFAGVPLVTDLVFYSIGVRCSWFHVTSASKWSGDQELRLALNGQPQCAELPQGIAGPLSGTALADIAELESHELDWKFALEAMRLMKSAGGFHHPIFGVGYRPFFLLMVGDQGKVRAAQVQRTR